MNRRNGKLGIALTLATALLLQPCAGIKADAKTVRKSVTVYCGKTKTVKKWKAGAVKGYKVTYSRKNVAAVKVKKNGIQITGKKAGSVKVTVKVTKKNKKTNTYKYKVTVKKKSAPEEETDVKESMKPEQTAEPSPAASTKPTPIVELITAAPVVTPVPTEDTYVSDYSYELEVLNTGTLYTKCDIAILVKTNNTDGSTLIFSGNAGEQEDTRDFDDVYYDDTYNNGNKIHWGCGRNVKEGFLFTCYFEDAGKHVLELQEEIQIDVQYETVATIELTVEDGDQAEEEWIAQVVEEQTTTDMTAKEKMDAIRNYVYNEFDYAYNNDEGYVYLLAAAMLPYWEHKHIQCWDATYIMMRFADYFGLESEATDGSDKPGAGALHQYATVYIDGVAYEYDASPASATSYITEWEYIL